MTPSKAGLRQRLPLLAALAAAYFLAAKLGLALAYLHSSVTLVWPPSGIALAALLIFGRALWPGVFLGAFSVNLLINLAARHSPFAAVSAAAGMALGNTLEALLGSWLAERFAGGRDAFGRTADVLKFVLLAALAATAVAATLGVFSLAAGGFASWKESGLLWLTWWLGDAQGVLTIAPLILVWSAEPEARERPAGPLEFAAFVLALAAAAGVVLAQGRSPFKNNLLIFIQFPLLAWTAFRFGMRGVAFCIPALSGLAIWGTVHGSGPFASVPDRNTALFLLQTFLGATTVSALALASVIRERNALEAQRQRQSEEKFRLLVESVQDYGIFLLDPDGVVTSWNLGAQRITGYAAEEIVGRNFSCFYLAEDLAHGRPRQELRIAAARGWVEDEGWRVRKDGTPFWANVIVTALHDSSGRIKGFAKVTRDITERKEAQRALQASEEKFRSVMESAGEAVITASGSGHIVHFNPAATRIFGYSEGEAVGRPLTLLIPERFRAMHEAGFRRFQESGDARIIGRTLELAGLRKDGSEFPLELTISTWKFDDKPFFTAILRDITERKETEEALARARAELERRVEERTAELQKANEDLTREVERRRRVEAVLARQAQDLMRSNGELEQFAYIASHDLQEPLRMVASYTQLLEKRYRDRLDADAGKFIAYAVDGVTRMKDLINDLLEYSRLSSPKKSFAKVDCNEAFDKAVGNLQVVLKERKAEVSRGDLPTVTGEFSQIVELFQNLISNGVKFNKRPKPAVRVSAEESESSFTFSVRDDGIGIDPEYRERIFVIFQRLHGKDEYPGTGIGLTICKKIVERHGGRIWLDSQAGRGSTFFFTLPKNPDEEVRA